VAYENVHLMEGNSLAFHFIARNRSHLGLTLKTLSTDLISVAELHLLIAAQAKIFDGAPGPM
jgi:hypothetical protein